MFRPPAGAAPSLVFSLVMGMPGPLGEAVNWVDVTGRAEVALRGDAPSLYTSKGKPPS
jgi:hypothetical protein